MSPRMLSVPLLLLLGLGVFVEARTIVPQKPGCASPEVVNFLQEVKVNLSLPISLSPRVNSRKAADYATRSTSPWDLRRREDPERYPAVIWEAECRHLGCVNAQGEVDHGMNSVPIQQEVLVLRREPQHCPPSFRLEKMLVAVGCTCVSPVVRHVS
ncbi:PREDICTED: interleukin-17A [Dipodomys ordii]|uniref:Interleukin-17A n=1 Tax=Dipodomys ordii TaxID=10020 RepID=A0A1S3FDG8_DIPOR|nr:PREDICTED: interleukin-17A [Dipodomys ordii]XP_042527811.1 interleukin-17A [Dipodomys spectabilis]